MEPRRCLRLAGPAVGELRRVCAVGVRNIRSKWSSPTSPRGQRRRFRQNEVVFLGLLSPIALPSLPNAALPSVDPSRTWSASSSHPTPRWREPDSNHRSRSCENGLAVVVGRTDRLDGLIKHRSSRATTMVGRGPPFDGRLFTAGQMVRIRLPPARSHMRTRSRGLRLTAHRSDQRSKDRQQRFSDG
jgi:hypothetical protein